MASGGNRHPDAASGGLHVATNGRRVTARRPSASDSIPRSPAPRAAGPAAATAPRPRMGHDQYRVESRRRRRGRARTTSCTRPRAAGTFLAPASRRSESTARADHHLCGINQCVGCTRQFFTESFLGDDAAALAPSSGEEPASPRHRAGVASMAWR